MKKNEFDQKEDLNLNAIFVLIFLLSSITAFAQDLITQQKQTAEKTTQQVKAKSEDPYKMLIKELRKQTPDIKIIQELIIKIPKEKLEIQDTTNINAFFNAIKFGNIELISIMLQNGFSANVIDNSNQTPLHKAALMNDYNLYEFLEKTDVDYKSKKDTNDKYAYELFKTFTYWSQLDLQFTIVTSVIKPEEPLTYYKVNELMIEESRKGYLIFSPTKFQGQIFKSNKEIIVLKCLQTDGCTVGIINANTVGNFILFESDDLFVGTRNLFIPIGSEIITNNLILWGKSFSNCKIHVLEKGILEIPGK